MNKVLVLWEGDAGAVGADKVLVLGFQHCREASSSSRKYMKIEISTVCDFANRINVGFYDREENKAKVRKKAEPDFASDSPIEGFKPDSIRTPTEMSLRTLAFPFPFF